MIKLYDYTKAPSPRRARIFLAEKGVDYETIQIDLAIGEQFSENYRAINPRCAVPALTTEDGQVLTENLSIASYIDALYPEPPLMGTDPISRARILEWNWRCEFEGLAAIAEILRNTSPHMKDRALTGPHNIAQIPEMAERGCIRLGHFFNGLNETLKHSEYLCGEQYSLADITAMVAVDFSKWVKQAPDDSLTALHEWHARIAARPASSA